ncbi:MAG: hypothetical protein O3C40_24555 [Planctomycetota bacterium]|nr:hypothetical protein [Planctomycetota bacterium]
MSGSQHHRLRLRFSLRTFLLVSVVGTVVFGIYLRGLRQQRDAVAIILEYGGTVQYDYQLAEHGEVAASAESWVPDWLLSCVGEDPFTENTT